ncbi:LysR family transcriptional regulator for metE and metH [Providencia alcalifaciens]|nr:LysR family transcriptional regulator for metE and metH [Providencia alcalifaciens]
MIELKHLKTLQALSLHGSLAATATYLHQTQSALSHQFSDLEHRLGFKLFVRKSQPLRFTPQGEVLLQLAQQVLPMVKDAIRVCHEPGVSTLRIAIECHSCIQWLTPALQQFRQTWSQVSVDFKSGMTFEPQPELLSRELDIVMTSDILADQAIHYTPMFDYEVKLIVANDHPLAKKPIIEPHDLADETLMIYPVQRNRFDVWRHFLQPAGVSPTVKTVDNTLILIQMVAAKMGIAALPHWAVDSFEKQGLITTKTLGNGLWSRLYAACREGEQRQPAIEAFTKTATNHAVENLSYVKPVKVSSAYVPTEKQQLSSIQW